mgnify:CR=1 FL=1
MADFKKVKKESLTNSIVDRILKMISTGELKKGDLLPSQKVLAESFGVSQSPIREALHALEAMGAVKIKVGEGTYVNDEADMMMQQIKMQSTVQKYKIHDLVQARVVLESAIIELAIKNMNDDYKKMLDDNRYCGDILTQIAAVESALQSFGYIILQDHLETCVVEEIQNGNKEILEEAIDLIKKLK